MAEIGQRVAALRAMRRLRIKLSELNSFAERYTTLAKLAKENGMHVGKVRHTLLRLAINPIGGRNGRYGGFPVYSWHDLR